MEKKDCSYCANVAWHNPMKDGGWRCTKCGYPFSKNPARSEHQQALGRKLAKRLV